MIGLVLAAALQSPAPPTACHPVDSKQLSQLAAEVRAVKTDDLNAEIAMAGALAEYWANTCRKDRTHLSKFDVQEISSLLEVTDTQNTYASMLGDVGKNLHYASDDVSAALKDAEAREAEYGKASPIWVGPPPASYALRCLQSKIRTGVRSKRLCWTLQDLKPEPPSEPGAPITFEAREIKLD